MGYVKKQVRCLALSKPSRKEMVTSLWSCAAPTPNQLPTIVGAANVVVESTFHY